MDASDFVNTLSQQASKDISISSNGPSNNWPFTTWKIYTGLYYVNAILAVKLSTCILLLYSLKIIKQLHLFTTNTIKTEPMQMTPHPHVADFSHKGGLVL